MKMTVIKGNTDSRELIKKFFEGNYPAEIEKRFHLWLLSERKWDDKDAALEDMWEKTPSGDPKAVIGSLNNVRQKIGFPIETVKLGSRRTVLRVAAVVIPLLLLAGGYIMIDRLILQPSVQTAEYMEAQAGSTVSLSDNTVIEVMEGMLTYPTEFTGDERTVVFEGNGYFNVAYDPQRPFVVQGPYLAVRVTGTEFMIATDNDNMTSTVALVEGAVEVLIEGKEPVALVQGTELKYEVASGDVTVNPLPAEMTDKEALTKGTLIFNNATAEEIIRAVAYSRGYSVTMKKAGLGSKQYNVKFVNSENIEEILGVLNVLTNSSFTYIIENDSIIIE